MLAGAGLSYRTSCNFTARKGEHSRNTDTHMLICTRTASIYILNMHYKFHIVKSQTTELLHKNILLHFYCLNLHPCWTELRLKMTLHLHVLLHKNELRRVMPWERRHHSIRAFSVCSFVSSPLSPK